MLSSLKKTQHKKTLAKKKKKPLAREFVLQRVTMAGIYLLTNK